MEGSKESKAIRMAIIGIVISLLTIIVILKFTETKLTLSMVRRMNIWYVLLAVLFQVLFWLFWAIRLKMVVSYLGHSISMVYSLETTISSMFLAAITPSSAGGEPLRIKMLKDDGMSVGAAAASVLTERILDSIFFAVSLPVFIVISKFAVKFGFEVSLIFSVILVLFLLFIYFFKLMFLNNIILKLLSHIYGILYITHLSANIIIITQLLFINCSTNTNSKKFITLSKIFLVSLMSILSFHERMRPVMLSLSHDEGIER